MSYPSLEALDEGLSALNAVDNWDDLKQVVRDVIAKLGGNDFSVKVDPISAESSAPGHLLSTLPESVSKLFLEPSFALFDPINQRFAQSQLPQYWRPEDETASSAPAVYSFLSQVGIRHGLSLNQRGQHVCSRIDFYSRDERWGGITNAVRGAFVYLGMHVHEVAESVWRHNCVGAEAPNAPLSARELECLHWGALGKTSREIGLILGISQRTVYFHLNNAAAKLNVYSVKHAISRALSSGLVRIGR